MCVGVDIKCEDKSTSMSVNRLQGETTGYLLATLRAIRAKLVYISSSIHTCAAINAFVWYGKGKRSTLNCKTLGPYNAATFLTVGHACLQSGQVKSTKAERWIGAVGSPPLKTKPKGRFGKGICDSTQAITSAIKTTRYVEFFIFENLLRLLHFEYNTSGKFMLKFTPYRSCGLSRECPVLPTYLAIKIFWSCPLVYNNDNSVL